MIVNRISKIRSNRQSQRRLIHPVARQSGRETVNPIPARPLVPAKAEAVANERSCGLNLRRS